MYSSRSGISRVYFSSSSFTAPSPFKKVLVARVRVEVRHVDEVVDPSLNIGHGRLIRGKSPLIVHHKLEGVLALLEVVDVREIVA